MPTAVATLRQSGGSVIMAIPKVVLDMLGVGADSQVTLTVNGRCLTITPGYPIEDLVGRITPENSHEPLAAGERGAERIDW